MYGEMKCIHPESNIELDPSFCGPLSPQELQSCNYGSCKITAELAQAEGSLYEYRTNGGINGFRPVV